MQKNILADDQEQLMGTALASGTYKGLALVLVAYTGARANEILRLSKDSLDVTTDTPRVFIRASKRGQDRWIPLPDIFLARIKSLRGKLRERSCRLNELICDASNCLSTGYQLLKKYYYKLQIELFGEARYTLHSNRHTLAISAIQNGWDVLSVKKMLGHKSLDATMKYLEHVEAEKVLSGVHKLVGRGKI